MENCKLQAGNFPPTCCDTRFNKKDGPCHADIPEAKANRWKGTPRAHNRSYPSGFKLADAKLFVKLIAETLARNKDQTNSPGPLLPQAGVKKANSNSQRRANMLPS